MKQILLVSTFVNVERAIGRICILISGCDTADTCIFTNVLSVTDYSIFSSFLIRFSQKAFMVSLACDHCHKILLVGVKCKYCK